jgi:hypothetical protein
MTDVTCPSCGNIFYAKPANLRRGKGKYCSEACRPRGGAANPGWKGGVTLSPEYRRNKRKRFRTEHPDRHKAHTAVKNAVARGALQRGACEVCGQENAEAHHEDYGKPLDVKWLCKKHHAEHHAVG